jgi:hypothetical protein
MQFGSEAFIVAACIITQIIIGDNIKILMNIFALILILAGGVFFLQGINILPGSFMTGEPQWAVNGAILIVVGIGLSLWAKRRK